MTNSRLNSYLNQFFENEDLMITISDTKIKQNILDNEC